MTSPEIVACVVNSPAKLTSPVSPRPTATVWVVIGNPYRVELKPEMVTVYSPLRRPVKEYWPWPLVVSASVMDSGPPVIWTDTPERTFPPSIVTDPKTVEVLM